MNPSITNTEPTAIKKEWVNPHISELPASQTNQLDPPNVDDPLVS